MKAGDDEENNLRLDLIGSTYSKDRVAVSPFEYDSDKNSEAIHDLWKKNGVTIRHITKPEKLNTASVSPKGQSEAALEYFV